MATGKTILVVEDERLVAKELQRTLIGLGYHVPSTAASAEAAMHLAALEPPDLVLMDIRIEGPRDGIDTAALLVEAFDSAIVFVTAYADQETVGRAKLTEPHAYLVKPIKDAELRSSVEIALYKKGMERALREREQWFSTTLRSIGDGVIATDVDRNVTFLNRTAEELTGFSSAEAHGLPIETVFDIVNDRSRARVENPTAEALATSATVKLASHTVLLRRDGSEAPIDDCAAPIIDGRQQTLGSVLVFRDVRETRQLQSELVVADRLVSAGLLAAGVAHQINNPLAAVLANVELATSAILEANGSPGASRVLDEALEELRDAREASLQIRNVVRDLMLLSRSEEDVRGPVDVHSVLESTLRMAHNEIRHRARLDKRYGTTPLVLASESRLAQVFLNVLVNAAQAIEEGNAQRNTITITTGTDAAGHAVIAIADTGPGMASEVVDRLFQPFFTTKRMGDGTGLGLLLCRRIVSDLGGLIVVESQLGRGTTVRLTLPEVQSQAPQAAAVGAAQTAAEAERRGRVLVVDDELMVLKVWQRALGPGHDVLALASSEEALQRIRNGERFDVILCDLMMPQLTGMDLHRLLSLEVPEQAERMVFVTGGAFTSSSREFLDRVPNRVVEKPVNLDELLALVAEHIARPR